MSGIGPGPILVVDDDPCFRELMRRLLESRGFAVLVAEDGAAALELVSSVPVAAVVTDHEMPRLSGLELCRALRSQPTGVGLRIPVWVITGSNITRREAIAAGAKGMFRKPFKVREIFKAIERHLQLVNKPAAATAKR